MECSGFSMAAPWLSFVPTVYEPLVGYTQKNWADFGLTLDSMLFYFKNEKQGIGACVRPGCPWPTDMRITRLPGG